MRFFDMLLSTKSVKLDPTSGDRLRPWTTSAIIGTDPTVTEVADAVRTIADGIKGGWT